jgi:uncharacterized repeat protein (TIGR01451 family)/LPXTG-motif cell wall-anchored protein
LPAGLDYVSDTCEGTNDPPWTWDVGALGVDQTVSCEITVTATAAGEISNVATVDGPQIDPTPDNNTDDAVIDVEPLVDLAIEKSATPGSVTVGDHVTYTLTVRNLGPSPATGVVVTDPLPAEVGYLSDTCGGANLPPWTWQIGNLARGETVSCEITVQVTSAGEISNVAEVSGNEEERTRDNNASPATVEADEAETPPPSPPQPLPNTGSAISPLLPIAGISLTILGGSMLLGARARTRRARANGTG